jgi:hypothetical protein
MQTGFEVFTAVTMNSSGIQRCVDWINLTEVSDVDVTPIFNVEENIKQETSTNHGASSVLLRNVGYGVIPHKLYLFKCTLIHVIVFSTENG